MPTPTNFNININGVLTDLSDIFKPVSSGDIVTTDTGYLVNGTDFKSLFEKYSTNSENYPNIISTYNTQDGHDLSQIFKTFDIFSARKIVPSTLFSKINNGYNVKNYNYVEFTSNGSIIFDNNFDIDIIVVGAGGNGAGYADGNGGGGGGSGGIVHVSDLRVEAGKEYNIKVGKHGDGTTGYSLFETSDHSKYIKAYCGGNGIGFVGGQQGNTDVTFDISSNKIRSLINGNGSDGLNMNNTSNIGNGRTVYDASLNDQSMPQISIYNKQESIFFKYKNGVNTEPFVYGGGGAGGANNDIYGYNGGWAGEGGIGGMFGGNRNGNVNPSHVQTNGHSSLTFGGGGGGGGGGSNYTAGIGGSGGDGIVVIVMKLPYILTDKNGDIYSWSSVIDNTYMIDMSRQTDLTVSNGTPFGNIFFDKNYRIDIIIIGSGGKGGEPSGKPIEVGDMCFDDSITTSLTQPLSPIVTILSGPNPGPNQNDQFFVVKMSNDTQRTVSRNVLIPIVSDKRGGGGGAGGVIILNGFYVNSTYKYTITTGQVDNYGNSSGIRGILNNPNLSDSNLPNDIVTFANGGSNGSPGTGGDAGSFSIYSNQESSVTIYTSSGGKGAGVNDTKGQDTIINNQILYGGGGGMGGRYGGKYGYNGTGGVNSFTGGTVYRSINGSVGGITKAVNTQYFAAQNDGYIGNSYGAGGGGGGFEYMTNIKPIYGSGGRGGPGAVILKIYANDSRADPLVDPNRYDWRSMNFFASPTPDLNFPDPPVPDSFIFGHMSVVSGSNNDIFVGGKFNTIYSLVANRIAKWNKTTNTWSKLNNGLNERCNVLCYDSVNNLLYVGGNFTTAGDISSIYIACWNNNTNTWSTLASGLPNYCYSLAIDKVTHYLYAGGINYIKKWNGTEWSDLGTGITGTCKSICIDNSSNVYIGGIFTSVGTLSTKLNIAKWSNNVWSRLSASVTSLNQTEDPVYNIDPIYTLKYNTNLDVLYVGFSQLNINTRHIMSIYNISSDTWSVYTQTYHDVNSIKSYGSNYIPTAYNSFINFPRGGCYSIDYDASNNVYIAGLFNFYLDTDVDSNNIPIGQGFQNLAMLKYTSSGYSNENWTYKGNNSVNYPKPYGQYGYNFSVTVVNDNIYVSGSFLNVLKDIGQPDPSITFLTVWSKTL
jgi:hypothetical protein